MYGALWQVLPGPWPVRLLIMLLLAALAVAACLRWVFPWVADQLPMNNAGFDGALGLLAYRGV